MVPLCTVLVPCPLLIDTGFSSFFLNASATAEALQSRIMHSLRMRCRWRRLIDLAVCVLFLLCSFLKFFQEPESDRAGSRYVPHLPQMANFAGSIRGELCERRRRLDLWPLPAIILRADMRAVSGNRFYDPSARRVARRPSMRVCVALALPCLYSGGLPACLEEGEGGDV